VIIFDNFLADFEARRKHALSGHFKPVEAPGGFFPGINTDAVNDFPFTKVLTFYRLTLKGDTLPTFIHNDLAMARMTGILYLGRRIRRHRNLAAPEWIHRPVRHEGEC
jgi:hypothetical protein